MEEQDGEDLEYGSLQRELMKAKHSAVAPVPQDQLDSINESQSQQRNLATLSILGGLDDVVRRLGVDLRLGLSEGQYELMCEFYGTNSLPEAPMTSFFSLWLGALNDFLIIVLMIAAVISLALGLFVDGDYKKGWLEGTAIWMAVLCVSLVTAGNDYVKELKFRELERSSHKDEHVTVLRNAVRRKVHPKQLTVGDVVILGMGDGVPADGLLVTPGRQIKCNESTLTGEIQDQKKSKELDPFLLSSSNVTDGEEVKMIVIGIGPNSQWGRIKMSLEVEDVNTPLQDKLDDVAKLIGYVGTAVAVMTFVVLMIYVVLDNGPYATGVVDALILAVTIVVVAVPEGLPLAVTISLAYSSSKMFEDQNLIRVLSACETMGNATTICSDKTGTLTENNMSIVEGWFGEQVVNRERFSERKLIPKAIKDIVAENALINTAAFPVPPNASESPTNRTPVLVGNATDKAFIMMATQWGYNYHATRARGYDEVRDKLFAFNSVRKRSTAVVHLDDGRVRVYSKGASELLLNDCTYFMNATGNSIPISTEHLASIKYEISRMARHALRTLCVAHKDYSSRASLPADWQEVAPDTSDMILDCVVGIIDPLRKEVKEAIAKAQAAGIDVRMVTGDNLLTACAIAKQAGILRDGDVYLEGEVFRSLTPRNLDAILPRLKVLARSSPHDKLLLVQRLNGQGLPSDEKEWELQHPGCSYQQMKDVLLPGYRKEWELSRPHGGEVVSVTGDGTNDAPALRAADVGLSMGKSGTQVAKDASDIVILDDNFSSIVKAIVWGRCVYDNIRKFLQFQLTVNIVALTLVFIGAVAGFDPPLNSVMMLWVNLIMDTMGALALGTETPTDQLLKRKPYTRDVSLLTRPIWRNIWSQVVYQLAVLLLLLFKGDDLFNVESGSDRHFTIIFNSFVFCQVFNEFNSRILFNETNMFKGLSSNPIFAGVIVVTCVVQCVLVQFAGGFFMTEPLNTTEWFASVGFGALSIVVGVLARCLPIYETEGDFHQSSEDEDDNTLRSLFSPSHPVHPQYQYLDDEDEFKQEVRVSSSVSSLGDGVILRPVTNKRSNSEAFF